MATRGAPRPGVHVFGSWLLPVLVAGALTAGCGHAAGTGRSASPPPSTRPSPRATPPEELCARVVAYWSRKALDDDTYGDYQSMGLSNGQYEILREVVDAARAERKRQGAQAADELIDRRARQGCTDWYRRGGPVNGPWQ
ncbi:hypothetical protein RKE30_30845 [Streptomyces sp. Li-HN-5-11]|uniref:hypothetical protein n=1 Tax=Streptomyces sp. Li-HN-5-11 TaxID=3075432 RepID=UPI0028B142D5|nr:hypothetical protein [Streptomyces sp. Li-HN-5-11]WNM34451.1 hypothetical protein RKE30_30845 [Streptomyces sp. Li-HN-5-11]